MVNVFSDHFDEAHIGAKIRPVIRRYHLGSWPVVNVHIPEHKPHL